MYCEHLGTARHSCKVDIRYSGYSLQRTFSITEIWYSEHPFGPQNTNPPTSLTLPIENVLLYSRDPVNKDVVNFLWTWINGNSWPTIILALTLLSSGFSDSAQQIKIKNGTNYGLRFLFILKGNNNLLLACFPVFYITIKYYNIAC